MFAEFLFKAVLKCSLTKATLCNVLLKPIFFRESEWNLEAWILKWKYVEWRLQFFYKHNKTRVAADDLSPFLSHWSENRLRHSFQSLFLKNFVVLWKNGKRHSLSITKYEYIYKFHALRIKIDIRNIPESREFRWKYDARLAQGVPLFFSLRKSTVLKPYWKNCFISQYKNNTRTCKKYAKKYTGSGIILILVYETFPIGKKN